MVNHVERAYRAWPILAKCALNDRLLTYGELADALSVHHRAIRYILGVIQSYCLTQQLPPLTILVVNALTRQPGHGFIAWSMDDLDRGRAEVHAFDWQSIDNPFCYAADGSTEDELVESLISDAESASQVYARIKVRGTAQAIFRKALLRTYGGQCAFCKLSFEEALEASHLIPWAQASNQERLDPSNGVLLCSTHHRLFDAGWMTISASGHIIYANPRGDDGPYSIVDTALTVKLHGKPAALPTVLRHRPSEKALSRHHKIHDWGDPAID